MRVGNFRLITRAVPAQRPATAHRSERDSCSISHSRCIHLLLFLLLEVAEAVDGGEGIVGVRHPDTHGVVLIGYRGASVDVGIQDIFTLSHETPFPILGGVAEGGIEPQEGVDVVETLNGLGLEKWIEGELYVMLLRQSGDGHAAEASALPDLTGICKR